ncbi:DUF2158 domain-containing protein [Flavobacterium oreochromis]|uniref:DUF2158 domain-containing protein n=1 Tax=Flavobacterium oreochromis TaxID=2906078 RepID=UPI001CE67468|nr:DUF2158 domain-containing protein [Flavobacterium oreochromis]QYS87185.1 DUF2158 domain-containing protein [Flavobacterium oreochromis]QYS87197.1 DUF2158 domain-containing protein [Flavobacterium oreochromis]
MEEDFKIGDIVEFKTGSVKMMVLGVDNVHSFVRCEWFANNELRRLNVEKIHLKKCIDESQPTNGKSKNFSDLAPEVH